MLVFQPFSELVCCDCREVVRSWAGVSPIAPPFIGGELPQNTPVYDIGCLIHSSQSDDFGRQHYPPWILGSISGYTGSAHILSAEDCFQAGICWLKRLLFLGTADRTL